MWCYILYNHLYVQSYECRRLGDRFREHLRDVTRNDKDASKPVAKHLNLPTYSIHHMAFLPFPYIWAVRKAAKHQDKNLSSKSVLLIPTVSTSAFQSTNLFLAFLLDRLLTTDFSENFHKSVDVMHHRLFLYNGRENYSRSERVIRNPDVCGLTLASLLLGVKLESDVMLCTSCQPVL